MSSVFKSARATHWTSERLDHLGRQELLNLQANATKLGETELAELCARLIAERPRDGRAGGGTAARATGQHKFLPRSRAFGARGVYLQDPRTSWSGIRKADGMVVIAIWRAAIQAVDGGCACLLWSPNKDGARPWSDSAAGRERLEHCKLALERGAAEGLLVHGQPAEGRLPEDRARSVFGIDPETVVQLRVELRGSEYWATWGKKKEDGRHRPAN